MVKSYPMVGTCASQVSFDIREGRVYQVSFAGGCPGNLQAVAHLVEGLPVEEVIQRLQGIRCGAKPTSCADQFATVLRGLSSHE